MLLSKVNYYKQVPISDKFTAPIILSRFVKSGSVEAVENDRKFVTHMWAIQSEQYKIVF